MRVIEVGEFPSETPPDPALADIWPRARAVLRHYAWFNADEARVRDLQFGILQNSAFIVPSLFRDGGDACHESFYFQHRIFYLFHGDEPYFWASTVLDRCYALAVLYLPARGVALSLYPFTADADLLQGFEAMRAGLRRLAPSSAVPSVPPLTVVGYFHLVHHFWNELSALERAVAAGMAPRLRLAAVYQPMGPLDQLFPELCGRVEAVALDEAALNDSADMLIALGSWSIPPGTQARIRQLARRLTPAATLAEQERFRARHGVVFWLSVKPPERTCSNQAQTLAAVIEGLHARHPGAGFLLDGVSYPSDWENPNYPGWFRDLLATATAQTGVILDDLVARLPPALRSSVRFVTDVPVTEEVTWASLADFYFCHGGSMQNKIGWLHPTPGVVHSNTSFNAGFRSMIPPVEQPAPVYYLPAELVQDDDPAGLTALQLARKDQNYRLGDTEAIVALVLGYFDAHAGPGGAGRPSPSQAVPLEHSVPPMADDEARIAMATRPRDCDVIAKVPGAGEVRVENGERVQIMHNGLRVVADGYCGAWMTRLIERCEGHHEPQEERMFHAVLRAMPPDAAMIELGGYWSYYSLWFLHGWPARRAVVLEPDPKNLAVGRANAALNGLAPAFVAAMAGGATGTFPFASETEGELLLPCATVGQIMQTNGMATLDILHCDIQGGELAVLQSCAALFAEGRVRWAFVSTHAEPISGDPLTHQRCLAFLRDAGAVIEAEHDVHESFSGDGLIVARFGAAPAGWTPVALSLNRYSESLFRNPLYDLALARRERPR